MFVSSVWLIPGFSPSLTNHGGNLSAQIVVALQRKLDDFVLKPESSVEIKIDQLIITPRLEEPICDSHLPSHDAVFN